MYWYYVKESQQKGPVAEEGFEALVRSGEVHSETLVWNETMKDWKSYGEVSGGVAGGFEEGVPGEAGDVAKCSTCQRAFPTEDMIRYGDEWVCADCKPIVVQRVTEGRPAMSISMHYAGFWIRVGSHLIDGIIMGVANKLLSMLIILPLQAQDADEAVIFGTGLATFFLSMVIAIGYETFFIGKFSQTLGKMICGIKVVRADGSRVTYLRAFGRYWAKQLSGLLLGIGYLMVAFDEQKRGLHDLICDTRVIWKRR